MIAWHVLSMLLANQPTCNQKMDNLGGHFEIRDGRPSLDVQTTEPAGGQVDQQQRTAAERAREQKVHFGPVEIDRRTRGRGRRDGTGEQQHQRQRLAGCGGRQ